MIPFSLSSKSQVAINHALANDQKNAKIDETKRLKGMLSSMIPQIQAVDRSKKEMQQ